MIETTGNTVVATITVGGSASGVAITPDGKHAYVTSGHSPGTATVIDTASNTVVGTPIPVGDNPIGVAITPDGKHAYVVNEGFPSSGNVSVIATATNTVVATVTVGNDPDGVAVTPDGTHAYVVNLGSDTVSVITTAANTVVATVPVGTSPEGVAVTPDGKHAYVASSLGVSVIDTASNTVVATVAVVAAVAIAITPDGKFAYVTNVSNYVSVIETATNTVVGTVRVGNCPATQLCNRAVGILPPPPGIPFLAFNAKLVIQFGSVPNHDAFALGYSFTLSSTDSNGIDPLTEAVTLQVGTFAVTIPPGSFTKRLDGSFNFGGVIDGVSLGAVIKPTGTLRYLFEAKATGANLTGTTNTVYATLIIGGDSGATSVTAMIFH